MLKRTLSCDAVCLTATRSSLVDSAAAHQRVAALAQEFAQQLPTADLTVSADPDRLGVESLMEMLSEAARWRPKNYADEAARFAKAYPEAVEILPPDRYGDLVLLPALGCPNSRCSFCAFYKDRRFRIVEDREFALHLDRVCEFMGTSAEARNGIFLGSASALSLSQRIVLSRLEQIKERFGTRLRGVGAFWDPDHCPRRSKTEWQALKQLGLRTAYLGLETGLAELRVALGKSADIDRLLNKTSVARQGGVHLGVMVLAGVGELDQLESHVEHTASVVEAMSLSRNDLVFVSPLRGARPDAQLDAEAALLQAAISAQTQAKVAPYAAERFHYYA